MLSTKKVIIIAEAGVNHNGSMMIAKKLIDVAKKAGADIVKFQSFKSEKIASKEAKMANYQIKNLNKKKSQKEMLKKLEVADKELKKLSDYCKKKKILFLSSVFDHTDVDFQFKLQKKIIKIPSGEINNFQMLKKIAKKNTLTLLSTGMANLKEVQKSFKFLTKSGLNKKKIFIMQCTSNYPTKENNLNLNVLKTFKKKITPNIAFSDHSLGYDAAIISIAIGAKFIEKHFTLSRSFKGPDHKASLNPKELKIFINKIRKGEKILGSFIKKPNKDERSTLQLVRKSIFTKKNISKGEKLTQENIELKRPIIGIGAEDFFKVLGKKVKKDIKKNKPLYKKYLTI